MRLLDGRGFEHSGIVDENVDAAAERVQCFGPQRLGCARLRQVGGNLALAGTRGVANNVVTGERGDDGGADPAARSSDEYVQKSTLS